MGEDFLRVYPMSFSSCSLDMGRFVHGSTNEGGDDLSSSMGDEEGGVGVIINETRGRRRRDREGRWFGRDLLQDASKLRVSQSVLEAGPVKLRGKASEAEAVLGVGGVGCAEGADSDGGELGRRDLGGDGGELGRRDLGGECVDDGNGRVGRKRGVWELASSAEGFNVLLGDF